MRLLDLRSDTVTRPTPGMREAMARAEVGDDVYGEDPTVNRLEEEIAALTGKEAAIFVPTGTMGNQIALQCHTQRGEEVLLGESAHLAIDESGAGAAWAGVQFRAVGRGGLFTAAELAEAIHEPDESLPDAAARGAGEPAQPRRRALVPAGRRPRYRRARAREGPRAPPRRRADLERRRGARALAGRGRRALRHGEPLLLEGPRRAGRVGALRLARGDPESAPLPQDVRRRDAPGWRARGGGALRARVPPRAYRRGSRGGAADRGGAA